MVEVSLARAMWKEPKGFSLRQNGRGEYVFLHFRSPAIIEGEKYEKVKF